MEKENILVSACLLGVKCRYDGQDKQNDEILSLMEKYNLIPVCPEQLGGLETPRDPAEISGEKVLTIHGKDVSLNYENGAKEALRIAQIYNCKKAYLKSNSPMCGKDIVYDGRFTGNKIKGHGVLTKLLIENKFIITSK